MNHKRLFRLYCKRPRGGRKQALAGDAEFESCAVGRVQSGLGRRALKPIVPADIGTDDQLPITLAIAVPVKPVIPRLRRERTGSRGLLDRCSSRGDCARILAATDISKGRETDGSDRNPHGYLLGIVYSNTAWIRA